MLRKAPLSLGITLGMTPHAALGQTAGGPSSPSECKAVLPEVVSSGPAGVPSTIRMRGLGAGYTQSRF